MSKEIQSWTLLNRDPEKWNLPQLFCHELFGGSWETVTRPINFPRSQNMSIEIYLRKQEVDIDENTPDELPEAIKRPELRGHFQCAECGHVRYTYDEYVTHFRKHRAKTPYRCFACDVTFGNVVEFIKHSNSHMPEHEFQCGRCSYSSADRSMIEAHMSREYTYKLYMVNHFCSKPSWRYRRGLQNDFSKCKRKLWIILFQFSSEKLGTTLK